MNQKLFFLLILNILFNKSAFSETLSFHYGKNFSRIKNRHEHTFEWSVSYENQQTKHLGWNLNYYNEGHFEQHKRDGISLGILFYSNLTPFLSYSLSAGPYFYADTYFLDNKNDYKNLHGLGIHYKASFDYHFTTSTILHLAFNHINTLNSFNSNAHHAWRGSAIWAS